MNRFACAAAAAIALSAGTSIARAQGPISFGIAGGISIPTGNAFEGDGESIDNSDIVERGFHGTIVLGFKAPLVPFGLRGELMYTKFPGNEFDFGPIFGTIPFPDVSIISAHVNGLFELPLPIAKPYLIGGVGLYSSKADADEGGFFDDGSGTDSDRENDFGVNFGVGTKFQLTGLSTFVEVRYHIMFTGEDETADSPEVKNFKFIPITFGIMF